jgi:hypothetical protein
MPKFLLQFPTWFPVSARQHNLAVLNKLRLLHNPLQLLQVMGRTVEINFWTDKDNFPFTGALDRLLFGC